jgi:uncharacterized protein DUF6600
MHRRLRKLSLWSAVLAIVMSTGVLGTRATAQDDQDDPPSRVARLGYMEGSVSFQPAGESDWVGAVENRPMTTGDKLWADKGSRAELQLGSAVIRLSENTGVSFLNLDDNTVQLQLSSGAISIRVRRLHPDDDFEIDTPNLAFTLSQAGNYRMQASEDGSSTTVTLRAGEGQATGNGQTYTLHAGQMGNFSGTDSLNADVEQIGQPDQFDTWADSREHRYDDSRSAQYLSHDVVGYDDLDDNGDWRDDSNYGHVWYPHVDAGWAPYHEGHWDWIDPWGYTWVDDSSWGYAPFHYGRWVSVGGRWGWIAGPAAEEPVYAPALVVFIGAGGGGFGGNVGWFPLGPREVYVPSYTVSRAYVNRVNISSTTVNTTTITNVYNTTIINKTTNVTTITYANRTVPGAVTAVPQGAFAGAQPVARAAVKVTPQQIAAAPVSARVAVNPTREAVLGAKASSAGHVTAPPAAVANRQVIAKKTPPPAPPSFAQRQQAMAAHPGQPLARREVASMHPPAAMARPAVKVAPPGKPATATTGHPPANAGAARPGQPAPAAAANQPASRPGNQPEPNRPGAAAAPANRAPAAEANRPPAEANRPAQPNNQPNRPAAEPNRPSAESNRPATAQPNNRPPEANRPTEAPAHPPAAQPSNNRPEPNHPPAAQPSNRPESNRPAEAPAHPPAAQPNKPAAQPKQPENKPAPETKPAEHPAAPAQQQHPPAAQENRPPAAKPAPPPPKKEPAKTPEEKKHEEKPNGI